jgi:4-hydroxy-2-oxoheptanedioate aldolase
MRTNKIKAKMRTGERAYGCALSFPSAAVVELLGKAGMDYIFMDGEHGVFTLSDIEDMCRVADLAGMTPTARVPNIHSSTILQFLDRGVMGILGPHIITKADAEALVEACLFVPQGKRSFAGSRGNDYGLLDDGPAHMARMNEEILPMALLEDIQAIEDNLADILSVEHLEVFSYGPQDLAQSMGLPGQPAHPRVIEAMNTASDQIRAAGKVVGPDVMVATRINQLVYGGARAFIEEAGGA